MTAERSFYLLNVTFLAGELHCLIGDAAKVTGAVMFDYVRSFVLAKESDFWERFQAYDLERLVPGDAPSTGVFKVTKGSMILELAGSALTEEKPSVYWLSTADECLEVVAFAEPAWTDAEALDQTPP